MTYDAVSSSDALGNDTEFSLSTVPRMTLEHSNTKEIGRGSFGQVVRATFDLDQRVYAIKQSVKHIQGEGDLQHHLQEAYAASVCANPHLLRYYDSWVEEGLLHMRMEYLEGGNILRWPRPWRQADICMMLQQIGIALNWLHSNGIAHLDVKPENILTTTCAGFPGGRIFKLGDFGLARRIKVRDPNLLSSDVADMNGSDGGHNVHMPIANGAVGMDEGGPFRGENDDEGDHRYLCPVILAQCGGDHTWTKEADIFSLGASVVELMGGNPERARFGDFGPHFYDSALYPSDLLRRLVAAMCHGDPRMRPSALQVVETVLSIQVEHDPRLQQELRECIEPRRKVLASLQQQIDVLTRLNEESTDEPTAVLQ